MMLKTILFMGALFIAGTGIALADSEPKLLGTYGDWSAYEFKDGDDPVCYILAAPKKATGNYKKRGEVFVLVTHRPAEKTRNTFSVMSGYTYKSDATVTVEIDKQKFALFTQADTAWAPDAATDNRLVEALKKGSSMVIKGTSSKGTDTIDTYGLKGTGTAVAAIDKACPTKP